MGRKFGFSFSWKRAVGISKLKNKIARATGIPTTKSGRQRKVGRLLGFGGWALLGRGRKSASGDSDDEGSGCGGCGCVIIVLVLAVVAIAAFSRSGIKAPEKSKAPSKPEKTEPKSTQKIEPELEPRQNPETATTTINPGVVSPKDNVQQHQIANNEVLKPSREERIDAAKWRTWTAAVGGAKSEAKFIKKIGNIVTLEKRDGKVITVPFDKLIDDDKRFISTSGWLKIATEKSP